jgi:ATP-dependent Clp protease ATP-binding subunit ClpB
MTIQIELESLKNEKDRISNDRREKLEHSLSEKRAEVTELTKIWEQERQQLESLKQAKQDLENARINLESALRDGDLRRAAELRYSIIPSLEKAIPPEGEENATTTLLHEAVTSSDIANVVSRATGIPPTNLMKGEKSRLIHMEEVLSEKVKGQEQAISAVARAVRLSRAGLSSPKRPIASLMFLGGTGVGKTELCKALAGFLFDNPDNILRIDMSEYQEKHTVSGLIGPPPGYVGFGDSMGALTEPVRRKGYCVVLFDEIEKAHKGNTFREKTKCRCDESFITSSG